VHAFPSTFYSPAVIHLNNASPTADVPRRSIDPHSPTHAHPLIRSDASSEVDKVERVPRLPGHPLVRFLEIDSRSARRRGGFGGIVGEGYWRWRGDTIEDLRRVGSLEPKIFGVRRAVVGLIQELHRIDRCNARSIYAPWDIILNGKTNAPLPEERQP
jgi:hypothetical protein